MTRLEFEEQLIKYVGEDNVRDFTQEEYIKIEFVYTWHPAIKPVDGKRQIAIIWQELGLGMINDMYSVAKDMEALDTIRCKRKTELDEVEKKMVEIASRY